MKTCSITKLTSLSIFFGALMLGSVFIEGIFDFYASINDIILYIPRKVADIFYKCWFCNESIIFIAIFTFFFYALIMFLLGLLLVTLRKKNDKNK